MSQKQHNLELYRSHSNNPFCIISSIKPYIYIDLDYPKVTNVIKQCIGNTSEKIHIVIEAKETIFQLC